ncbi:MAG TPA: endonuclease/exonuclease/phosphatase family protein, partial [Steroidobacteraceae bacterium]|nr:endonuclease/exonuclease/phosphatase family protein [Steroidobacteraceae bacterium]
SVAEERGANGGFSALPDQALWRRIPALAALLTLSLLGASLLATTAGRFWLGDLAVHFPVQYAALALVTFVVFLIVRRPAWAALALAIAACNTFSAAPVLAARPPTAPSAVARGPGDPVRVRVASVNVLYTNRQFQRVADFIHRERPDAVVLVEMTDDWRRALASLDREYPYHYATRGVGFRGVNLWSRLPMKDVGVLPIGARQEPAIQATLTTPDGRMLRLFGVHATWPMAPLSAARRNQQLERLARYARETKGLPLVIVGDLNVTPFSPYFRRLLAEGQVRSAADGFGWVPTWPSFLLPAGIQIDHALVNAAVTVKSFRPGAADGSDHRPIVVDLLL